VVCRSEVVTDEGAFHKFISIAALHRATEHLACPLTSSPRQTAALAAVVEHSILGSNPVIHVQRNYTLTNSSSLVWYALLGLSHAAATNTGNLGLSAHSWRVEDARFRDLGENGLALDAEGPEESCVGKALVDFPEQPP
jgi:hypothetical protein